MIAGVDIVVCGGMDEVTENDGFWIDVESIGKWEKKAFSGRRARYFEDGYYV